VKRAYLAILIASILLLATVGHGRRATPSDQTHAKQIKQTASAQDTRLRPIATASNQGSPKPSSSQSANYTYNYYYPAPDGWLILIGQIATIISALLLTAFTGGLFWTSINQWRAIKEQAEAAKNTLAETTKAVNATIATTEVAKLTLLGDRPYLIVSAVERSSQMPTDIIGTSVAARFTVTNCGKRPAFIRKIVAKVRPTTNEEMPVVGNFSECHEIDCQRRVVVSGQSEYFVSHIADALPSIDDDDAIRAHRKNLILFGCITYGDMAAPSGQCETGFLWIYSPPFLIPEPFWFVGPEPYNYCK
jgi:hypothetical protein